MTAGALAASLSMVMSTGVASAGPSWLTYHGDAARTGNDTTEPTLLPIRSAWSSTLDGAVYGQPVVVNGRVIVATERNSIYGLDGHDGRILWHVNAGPSVTGIGGQAGCGDIDPLGIGRRRDIGPDRGDLAVADDQRTYRRAGVGLRENPTAH